jgi:hypothetical protein
MMLGSVAALRCPCRPGRTNLGLAGAVYGCCSRRNKQSTTGSQLQNVTPHFVDPEHSPWTSRSAHDLIMRAGSTFNPWALLCSLSPVPLQSKNWRNGFPIRKPTVAPHSLSSRPFRKRRPRRTRSTFSSTAFAIRPFHTYNFSAKGRI